MASAALQEPIAAKRAAPYRPDMRVEALREESEGRAAPLLPDGATYQSVAANGVPCEWIDMPGSRADRVFLFIHGGGYSRGSVAGSRATAAHIAAATGAGSLSVDYRLAPEHPFPAAVDDAHTAYRWLLDQGIDAAHVAVGVDVVLEEWPDMIHGWHGAAHVLSEAREAIARIGQFYREKVD